MEQKNTTYQDDEIQIDLLDLAKAYLHGWWLILIAAIIGGGLMGVYSKFILTPQYTSSALLYVLSKETTLTSLADLQIGSQLSRDYTVIIRTRPVLQEVIEKLDLDMTYRALRGKLSIANEEDTRILTLTVTDADPRRAKEIVDQVAASASDYIGDIMEMIPPKIIEDGEVSFAPVSPNNRKNAMLGALAGAALMCGVITVKYLLNDTVRTEEDVARYLGLTVLAAVPERGKGKDGKRPESKLLKNGKKRRK